MGGGEPINRVWPKRLSQTVADLVYDRAAGWVTTNEYQKYSVPPNTSTSAHFCFRGRVHPLHSHTHDWVLWHTFESPNSKQKTMSYVWFAHVRIRVCVGRENHDDSEGEKPTILGRSRYLCGKNFVWKKIKLDPFLNHQLKHCWLRLSQWNHWIGQKWQTCKVRGGKICQHEF